MICKPLIDKLAAKLGYMSFREHKALIRSVKSADRSECAIAKDRLLSEWITSLDIKIVRAKASRQNTQILKEEQKALYHRREAAL